MPPVRGLLQPTDSRPLVDALERVDLLRDDERRQAAAAEAGVLADRLEGRLRPARRPHVDSQDLVHVRLPIVPARKPGIGAMVGPPRRRARARSQKRRPGARSARPAPRETCAGTCHTGRKRDGHWLSPETCLAGARPVAPRRAAPPTRPMSVPAAPLRDAPPRRPNSLKVARIPRPAPGDARVGPARAQQRRMPSFHEARAIILDHVTVLGSEPVALLESSGRVLAAAVVAPCDLPRWDNSAMDGFAVRAADATAPAGLRIAGYIPAGSHSTELVAA